PSSLDHGRPAGYSWGTPKESSRIMRILFACLLAVASPALPAEDTAAADSVDLTAAVVVTPPGLTGPDAKAVQMLVEEIARRSHIQWQRADSWPAEKAIVIVGPAGGVQKILAGHGTRLPEPIGRAAAEGYRIGVGGQATAPVVWVAGNDPRGTLFGVGRLL